MEMSRKLLSEVFLEGGEMDRRDAGIVKIRVAFPETAVTLLLAGKQDDLMAGTDPLGEERIGHVGIETQDGVEQSTPRLTRRDDQRPGGQCLGLEAIAPDVDGVRRNDIPTRRLVLDVNDRTQTAAWVRSFTSSFRRMFCTCSLTVSILIPSE